MKAGFDPVVEAQEANQHLEGRLSGDTIAEKE